MAVNKEIKTRIALTIEKDMKKELEELAKKDNRTTSNYIITVLKEHLENIKK